MPESPLLYLNRLLSNGFLRTCPQLLWITPIILISCSTLPKGAYQRGLASYYGKAFHGKKTANGSPFNMYNMTAAHRKLPFGTKVKVINSNNQKSVVVTITDRGPFVGNRVIDLSRAAGQKIGLLNKGVAPVTLFILGSR